RRARDVRVKDRELVAVVLQEPGLGRNLELVAVRALREVRAGDVALGLAALEDDDSAGLVRAFRLGVLDERRAHRGRHYHQRWSSIVCAPSVQKSAERYFQPASARTATTTASSSSSAAMRRATWTTAPEETPAKMPSRSRSARSPIRDSSLET